MTTNDIKFYSVPLIINITLYRNNYIDNIIIGELKRTAYTINVAGNRDSFSVSVGDLKKIIRNKFKTKIDSLEEYTKDTFVQNVDSTFFLYNMLEKFTNLKLINVTVSNNRKYSRMFKVNDQNVIGFDYKILQGLVDYSEFVTPVNLERLNNFLKKLKLNQRKTLTLDSYYILRTSDYLKRISELEHFDKIFFERYFDMVELTSELIEPKLELDNTILIIKTDFNY